MMWLFAILIVLVMGAVAAVAAGRGGAMEQTWTDRPDLLIPTDGPIRSADLRRVRFPLAVRGYRMSDVDALLTRIAAEMEGGQSDPVTTHDTDTAAGDTATGDSANGRSEGVSGAPETD